MLQCHKYPDNFIKCCVCVSVLVKVLNSQTVNSDGLITVRSDLYLTAVMEDKDALFYCQVTYPGPGAEKMIESNQFNITVHCKKFLRVG